MNQKAADPRDLQLGRSNVKDNKELIDFYKELEDVSTTARIDFTAKRTHI